jgi:hypothetical protein
MTEDDKLMKRVPLHDDGSHTVTVGSHLSAN